MEARHHRARCRVLCLARRGAGHLRQRSLAGIGAGRNGYLPAATAANTTIRAVLREQPSVLSWRVNTVLQRQLAEQRVEMPRSADDRCRVLRFGADLRVRFSAVQRRQLGGLSRPRPTCAAGRSTRCAGETWECFGCADATRPDGPCRNGPTCVGSAWHCLRGCPDSSRPACPSPSEPTCIGGVWRCRIPHVNPPCPDSSPTSLPQPV